MSEAPTATATRPPAGGKRYLGMTRAQLGIVAVAFVGALAYILWKRHEAKASGASSTATATSTSTATSDELAGLQDEIDQLLAQQYSTATATSGGGGTTGTSASSTGTSTGATGTGTTGTSGASTATATTTKTSTSTTAPAKKTAGAISNLTVTATGKTTAKATWNPASGATGGYAYKVTQMNGKVVKTGNTAATSVSISGLTAGWTYNFGIQALPGGPGNNEHFTTKS